MDQSQEIKMEKKNTYDPFVMLALVKQKQALDLRLAGVLQNIRKPVDKRKKRK